MAKRTAPARRRLLHDARRGRVMGAIMAIMVFLTVLAAAFGIGAQHAASAIDRDLAGRLTVQVVEADTATRDRAADAIVTALRRTPGVARVQIVDRERLAALLEPWLGDAGLDPELPMPAMIDVDLTRADAAAIDRVERITAAIRADVRVNRDAAWLSPVRAFITNLAWLALGLVVLMVLATGAVALLAARAGLDSHQRTIDVLHMLGSTDVQIARLFQRRIALDTLVGGVIGTALALGVVWTLQAQIGRLGAATLAGGRLVPLDWAVLAVLPFAFAALSMLAARFAVLGTLRKRL
ncbi:cell division protein FtsX [Stakelama saccharophila]|uniref:FtsX-like permease family protein n=1 Tax=Stakelama saccharophila TaxID=3075605 RepID=A0ABZ0B8Y3_9SPHN|nr:FtsX-like permease family protein [Stakelama sp. W311]WNO53733.1 FtsX-like permease family protein [Stakelama sp. W311]